VVSSAANKIYADLNAAGIEALLDDRGERPGVMFAEADLMGIPHRLVIGERGLAEGEVEYKGRTDAEAKSVSLNNVVEFMQKVAL
jgi:prolyl-tRNA synthetase